jgi:hypothetical protein
MYWWVLSGGWRRGAGGVQEVLLGSQQCTMTCRRSLGCAVPVLERRRRSASSLLIGVIENVSGRSLMILVASSLFHANGKDAKVPGIDKFLV